VVGVGVHERLKLVKGDANAGLVEEFVNVGRGEGLARLVGGDAHGLSQQHGWILREQALDDFHFGRGEPARHGCQLVGALLGKIGAQTIIANQRNANAFEEGSAIAVGEGKHAAVVISAFE
jgi:hypothetical protein